jgi:hypothetical protein
MVMTRIIITTMVMEDGEDMTRTTMEVDTGAMAYVAYSDCQATFGNFSPEENGRNQLNIPGLINYIK